MFSRSFRTALLSWKGQGGKLGAQQRQSLHLAALRAAGSSTYSAVPHDKVASTKDVMEIPGPRRFPVVGSLLTMILRHGFDPNRYHLVWKAMIKEYGPMFRLHLPGYGKIVVVSNPDDIERMFRATMNNPIRIGFHSLAKVREETVDNYFENKKGILIENNEEWWRVRSRAQTQMMRPKNVSYYLDAMDQVALEFMDRISILRDTKNEVPEDFQFELYKWGLESVGLVALNRRLGCLSPDLAESSEPKLLIEIVNEIFELLNWTEGIPLWRVFPTPSMNRLKKCHQTFLEIADANISQTEAELLKRLEARQKDNLEGDEQLTLMEGLLTTPGLSRKDVVTIILDMLFAGIDTTSHTIGFALYRLARNPEAQKKAQEEVDRVVGCQKGPLTARQLGQLSYVKAVIKETFRVNPLILGTARVLEADTEFGGYLIPKGWSIMALTTEPTLDEKYFMHADKFLPERWLRHQPFGPIHPYASLPFSHGTRMCIGRRIAEQELYTFLTRLLQRYTVEYHHKDIETVTKLVFTPSEPLKFTFIDRT